MHSARFCMSWFMNFLLSYILKTIQIVLSTQKAYKRTMCTAETRLFVIRQSTNERWTRRTLIGRSSAVSNTWFKLAIIAVSEHLAPADVC